MSYIIELSCKANLEVEEIALWYSLEENLELGERFLKSVDEALFSIQNNPLIFPVELAGDYNSDIHKARIKTFPFNIFYEIIGETIAILSIYHTSRKPNEWK